jgi:hypothetical protein
MNKLHDNSVSKIKPKISGINLEKNYRLFIKTLNKFCELQI